MLEAIASLPPAVPTRWRARVHTTHQLKGARWRADILHGTWKTHTGYFANQPAAMVWACMWLKMIDGGYSD